MLILGPPVVNTYRWQQLQVQASSSIVACGKVISGQLQYSWRVFKGVELVPALTSQSLDPRVYLLPPFSLDSNTQYTLQVIAAIIGDPTRFASASVIVKTGISGVFSSIKGGSQVTASTSEALVVDASDSYDIDYPDESYLVYSWKCVNIAPYFGSNCPIDLSSNRGAILSISKNVFSSSTIQLTLTVSNKFNATSSVSVKVEYINGAIPSVSIAAPNGRQKTNADLIITAFVEIPDGYANLTWSCFGISSNELSLASYTSLESTLFAGQLSSFNLILAPNSLLPGAQYTFILTIFEAIDSQTTVNSVTVSMNAPPVGGNFICKPRHLVLADI